MIVTISYFLLSLNNSNLDLSNFAENGFGAYFLFLRGEYGKQAVGKLLAHSGINYFKRSLFLFFLPKQALMVFENDGNKTKQVFIIKEKKLAMLIPVLKLFNIGKINRYSIFIYKDICIVARDKVSFENIKLLFLHYKNTVHKIAFNGAPLNLNTVILLHCDNRCIEEIVRLQHKIQFSAFMNIIYLIGFHLDANIASSGRLRGRADFYFKEGCDIKESERDIIFLINLLKRLLHSKGLQFGSEIIEQNDVIRLQYSIIPN